MSSITEEIEEKFNIKIEDLNQEEKATYFKMLEQVQTSQLTPERLKDYITYMREEITKDIVKEPAFTRVFLWKVENPNLIKLQARLQNYVLLESFLLSSKRAKQALEDMIGNLEGK